MKKVISMVMAALMLFTVLGALAEEGQLAPLYATLGEALEDGYEGRVIAGGEGDYYAVVTQKDGKYYRSVAYLDERAKELDEATNNLDFEAEDFFDQLEAAMNAAEEYRKTLPIAYSEVFTAEPLTNEEMKDRMGKTLAQLTEEGFEIGSNGTEAGEGEDEMIIVYLLRYGVFDYYCVVDADFDQYIAAQENGEEGGLVIKDMTLAGITEWGFEKRFHTDGTVDEPEDPFAEFGEILSQVAELIEKAQAGEEIDLESFAETLKEKYPDYADMIDMYVMLYKTYGADGLASMVSPAE